MIKIGILTTDTLHHRYFINKINARFPLAVILFENGGLNKRKLFWKKILKSKGFLGKLKAIFLSSYLQLPIWEGFEHNFENKMFFKTVSKELPLGVPVLTTESVNSEEVKRQLSKLGLDVIILFGVNKISEDLIKVPSKLMMNVHRGIVPRYRGLDSDLWAIYFNDYSNIGVTIHEVKRSLDTGGVIYQEMVDIGGGARIYHLRYHTTIRAAELVLKALSDICSNNLKISEQNGDSGYFSFMPFLMKFAAMYKFSRHIKKTKKLV